MQHSLGSLLCWRRDSFSHSTGDGCGDKEGASQLRSMDWIPLVSPHAIALQPRQLGHFSYCEPILDFILFSLSKRREKRCFCLKTQQRVWGGGGQRWGLGSVPMAGS